MNALTKDGLVPKPCRRCGLPHATAASRSACPWTDQPEVHPLESYLDAVHERWHG